MAEKCLAFASSTGSQCKNSRTPGSRYCLSHLDKGKVFAGVLLGAVLSLVLKVAYSSVVPSNEVRKIDSLTHQLDQRDEQLSAALNEASRERARHAEKLAEIQGQLDPFLQAATARYPDATASEALIRLHQEVLHLQSRMSNAEAKVDDSAKALGEMKELAAPRLLTEESRRHLSSALTQPICQASSVFLRYPIGDPEALDLANALAGVFKAAGWDTSPVYAAPLEGTPEGLFFEIAQAGESDRCFIAVHRAFADVGLRASARLIPSMKRGDLSILVAHKPRH